MTTMQREQARPDRMRRAVLASWHGIRQHPVTVVVILMLIAGGVVTTPLRDTFHLPRTFFATGLEPITQAGNWWSPITSVFIAHGLAGLVVALAAAFVLLGPAEKLLGPARTVIAFVVTPFVGVFAGVGIQVVAGWSGELWARHVTEYGALDPLTAITGTLMAASAFASALWRRRIRIIGVLGALVFFLYAGHPDDLYRLLAIAAGLLLGVVMQPNSPLLSWTRSSHHEIRVLMASVVAITALGPLIAVLSSSRFGPLAPIALLLSGNAPGPHDATGRCSVLNVTRACLDELTLERIANPGAILVSVIPVALLLIAAYGLLRGRRFALWMAVTVNGFFALLALFYFGFLPVSGLPYVAQHANTRYWEVAVALAASALIPAATAVMLLLLRRHFSVMPSRRRVIRYLTVLVAAFVALSAVYLVGGWLIRQSGFTRPVTFWDLMWSTVERFIPVSFLHREPIDFLPSTPAAALLYQGVGAVFWLIAIIGCIPLMRDRGTAAAAGERGRVRALLRLGGDPISFMVTWPGNRYWFDPEQRAAVAYRVILGIAITTGAPFGVQADVPGAMRRFARWCDDHGWIPVFYSVSREHEEFFAQMGWSSTVVAEETLLRPQNWNTAGKKWQDVRTSINRAKRAGVNAVWTTHAGLSLSLSTQVREISEQWVAEKSLPEMTFTLGGLDELRDPEVHLMLAVGQDQRVEAVTSWLPVWRDGRLVGWTLDFMRRRPGGVNGIMEFLIASAAEQMREDGIESMSLSAAPLAHTSGSGDEDSALDRLLEYIGSSLEPMYGFRSLLAFKAKFQPEYQPLIMAYPAATALPTIGLALMRAYLPTMSLRQVLQISPRG